MANAQAPTTQHGETNLSGMQLEGIQSCFWTHKFTKATEGERLKNLKAYREDSNVRNMAKAVFDFSIRMQIVLNFFSKPERT